MARIDASKVTYKGQATVDTGCNVGGFVDGLGLSQRGFWFFLDCF